MSGELRWFKSSYSDSGGADCVEVALAPHTIHIRDSKNPGGPDLTVSGEAWAGFLAGQLYFRQS
ncbi:MULTISPECIES: DUF397 domain-containing protein [Streptomyces]|uniref:DUF397 domain-containing protein n=1 Tax=Streptomyces liliifuscus TaxID=2797636 RepID=A0A7T7I7E2_9ACTN|nr:DUF397 domain-containing protein [Streptomyces liliifuscus]QQM42414.1 DUF397 domain-containing protein [Streptomyces liliifuscus]